jgi:hypothetical protein
VAIVTIVVGLLVATCGFLLVYGISSGAKNINTLKGEYLEQIADTAVREVARPLDAAVRLYLGKQLDKYRYGARVHGLGAGGAEITSEAPSRSSRPFTLIFPSAPGWARPIPSMARLSRCRIVRACPRRSCASPASDGLRETCSTPWPAARGRRRPIADRHTRRARSGRRTDPSATKVP